MAVTHLQFAGLHQVPFSEPNLLTYGILNFGTWNGPSAPSSDQYVQSSTIEILTPGVPNIGGTTVNGAMAGSFLTGQNSMTRGFAAYANSTDPTTPPTQPNYFSIGCLDVEKYESVAGMDFNDFNALPGGFFAMDQSTRDTRPGNSNPSDIYTVIMASSIPRGATNSSAEWGRRIIFEVSETELAAFTMKMVYEYAAYSGNWTLTSGDSDELAAAHLLVNGYGLLYGGAPIYWQSV